MRLFLDEARRSPRVLVAMAARRRPPWAQAPRFPIGDEQFLVIPLTGLTVDDGRRYLDKIREHMAPRHIRGDHVARLPAAVDLFGNRGTVEIAALYADYLMITTVYNALGMRLRPDQEATLPQRAGAPVGAEWR